ncbi:unnamed protein product [Meganyctiphanes norvegica]|uniref:DUF4789 domain-containing protein n=1 Tax=Meganyctiphanes norvegica TaxID=48144 RepID=A0AAV2Q0L5_MEGNR
MDTSQQIVLGALDAVSLSLLLPWVVMLLVSWVTVESVVIPPTWVNATLNPCAATSWQLLYWSVDDTCHRIFTQGPCLETQEFYFDHNNKQGACRCPRGTYFYSPTGRCYKKHTRGPCPPREFLTEMKDGVASCRAFLPCPPRHIFWPPTDTCYEFHTQGPCLKGNLIYINPETGFPECGCNKDLMFSNYWPLTGLCFEMFKRGPCLEGSIFLYNATAGTTQCSCSPSILTNYHHPSKGCYELHKQGPCYPGQNFNFHPHSMTTRCTCRENHALHLPTGHCYRIYTQGPCGKGHFFMPQENSNSNSSLANLMTTENIGVCMEYPCTGTQRYSPEEKTCFKLGWRGPCSEGELFIYDESSPLRGMCGCTSELVGYWVLDGRCYELGKRGPCQESQMLAYTKSTGRVYCTCNGRRGYIQWRDGRCYKLETRGPCPSGQVLVVKSWDPLTPGCSYAIIRPSDKTSHTIVRKITTSSTLSSPQEESNSVRVSRVLLHNDTMVDTGSGHTNTTVAQSNLRGSDNSSATSALLQSLGNIYALGSVTDDHMRPESVAITAEDPTQKPRTLSPVYFTGRVDGRRSLDPWWAR